MNNEIVPLETNTSSEYVPVDLNSKRYPIGSLLLVDPWLQVTSTKVFTAAAMPAILQKLWTFTSHIPENAYISLVAKLSKGGPFAEEPFCFVILRSVAEQK